MKRSHHRFTVIANIVALEEWWRGAALLYSKSDAGRTGSGGGEGRGEASEEITIKTTAL